MVRKGKEMKNLLLLVLGSALLVSPSVAQTSRSISLAEFRQTLSDYLTITDEYRGTNYAPLLATVPDATLAQWYTGVQDGRGFQQAVSGLKASVEARRNSPAPPAPSTQAMAASPASRRPPLAPQSPISSPFVSGIAATPVPDYSLYPPNWASGPDWSLMTSELQGLGYLPSGNVSNVGCDVDKEAQLSVIVSTFHGIANAADQICEAIPDETVIVLGEGTTIPAKEVCYGIDLIIGAFNSAFDIILTECQTQDDLVDAGNAQAGYNNTVSLYNLEFRLMVEDNLGNTASPMGLFELPAAQGGYLESVRAIVNNIISDMAYAGVSVTSAQAALSTGDVYYGQGKYKSAYKEYQTAYGLAVD
jgi:hypothetical protein